MDSSRPLLTGISVSSFHETKWKNTSRDEPREDEYAGNASARICLFATTLSFTMLEDERAAVAKTFEGGLRKAEFYDCGLFGFYACKGGFPGWAVLIV